LSLSYLITLLPSIGLQLLALGGLFGLVAFVAQRLYLDAQDLNAMREWLRQLVLRKQGK